MTTLTRKRAIAAGLTAALLVGGASLAHAQSCGDPSGDGSVKATDALTALQTAVGSASCDPCYCDVTGMDGVKATDALFILQFGVGQMVTLDCPPCGTTSTTSSTSTTTSTTTTTMGGGGSPAAGQAFYDSNCSFCHAASPHDTVAEFANDLAGKGSLVISNLGSIDAAMTGITLTSQEIADLMAFLDGIKAGQDLYDAECSFCHAASPYDSSAEFASDLRHDGNLLVADLGPLDPTMTGITLTDQEIIDLGAFLDSLP